jgi:excisionase family DNA binding protein
MTAKPTAAPRLLSVNAVATVMAVSSKTIRRWIDLGDLHVHRIGHMLRISEEDLIAFTAARRR